MNKASNSVLADLWRFVRGDFEVQQFEAWVYRESELEDFLPNDLYLELISTDFRSRVAIADLKTELRGLLESRPMFCQCMAIADLGVVDMDGDEPELRSLKLVAEGCEPYWWLEARVCEQCGQAWLVAVEECHNDIYCMMRLSQAAFGRLQTANVWPSDFDRYETLLRIGADAGRAVSYIDWRDSGLPYMIQILATQRPNISDSEIAELLNIDRSVAAILAKDVIRREGVQIDLSGS